MKSKAKTVSNSLIVNGRIITIESSVAEILSCFLSMSVQILRPKYRKQKSRLINLKMSFQE